MAEMSPAQRRQAERKKRIEEQRRKRAEAQAAAKAKAEQEKSKGNTTYRTDDKGEVRAERRDWTKDLGGLVRTAGNAAADAGKAVGGALVNEEAWAHTARALTDGPGGEEVRGKDLLNMALDASMAIPGAGLAGAAARVGARQLLKTGAREAGEAATRKMSPLAEGVIARQGASGGARAASHRGAGPVERALKPLDEAKTKTGEALARVGTRGERLGKGTKIGMGQSRRRTLTGAALAGGANLAAEAYDSGLGSRMPEGGTRPGGNAPGGTPGVGAGFGALGGYYFVAANGEAQAIPDSAGKALAASYENMGGSPDGSQVIYLGR